MKVSLKKWTLDDKKALIYICNNVNRKYLSNRIPFPFAEKNATWWLEMVQKEDGKTGIFRAIVVDNEYVGNISVECKSDVYEKDCEIGYLLIDDKWSKGIMTEAVKQICEIAFSNLDILRITGLVYSPNDASKRVLEKNGFVSEGIMKNGVFKNNNIYDLCIYGKYR